MNFENYKKNYTELFIEKHGVKNKKKLEENLLYSEKLIRNNLPVIFDANHFSGIVGYEVNYIFEMTNYPERFYKEIRIRKNRSQELRIINSPTTDLKAVQKWILSEILECVPISIYAKGYLKGKSVVDNAKFHKNQDLVIKFDIKEFFDSILIKHVRLMFLNLGYNKKVTEMLSRLVTYKGSLVQGAPTSPYISNIIMKDIDNSIFEFCRSQRISGKTPNTIRYTRYADDLTFSGSDKSIKYIKLKLKIESTISYLGLQINHKKTRVLRRGNRQIVTGIIVNNRQLSIPKYKIKKIRQDLYYIKKFGLDSHLKHLKINISPSDYITKLLGRINFALMINPDHEELREYYGFLLAKLDLYNKS